MTGLLKKPRRPPLPGVILAVGLHLIFLGAVQIIASKNSAAGSVLIRPSAMTVRSIQTLTAAAPEESSQPADIPIELAQPPIRDNRNTLFNKTFSKSASVGAAGASEVTLQTTRSATAPSPSSPVSETPLKTAISPTSNAIDLPPAPSYRAAGTLDPGPKPLSDINPDYPVRAGQQQGLVVLRLLINEQGVVDNVAVVRSTPLGYFEESALQAFGAALFSPGRLLGVAVKSQITVEVEFLPINRGATVSGRTY